MQDSPEVAPLSPHQPPSPLPNATVAIPGREAAVQLDDCLKYCIVAGKKALESSGLGGWFIVKVNVFSHECLLLGLSVVATSIGLRLVSLIWWCFLGVFWLRLHSPLRRSWSIVLVTCVVSPDSCCFIFILMGIALLFQAFLGDVSWKGSGLSKGLLCKFRGFGSRLAVSAK
ncbi:hypothetical protein DY000_02054631 [Brassica cretica]|uniref:Uncharacterized protein n=1 Tax=Brassica cretica TaxID=69181 RepID=A0ABQ7A5K4_BRACR|nr:hypothetical protein DY000_02054631 [Brassica cretica]